MTLPFRLGSFSVAGCTPFAGVVRFDDHVVAVEALRPICQKFDLPLSAAATLHDLLQDWDRNLASISAVLELEEVGDLARVPVGALARHAPVPRPQQVICVGANYRKHVVDLLVAQGAGAAIDGQSLEERRRTAEGIMDERARFGTPYAWVKSNSSVTGPDDSYHIPTFTQQADWELELAVVIGKRGFRISRERAYDHVAGYMIANDLTARDMVYRNDDMKVLGTDWLRAKCGPGFLPTGPYLVPRSFVPDPKGLTIRLAVNGQVMQDESTSDMIFDITQQIQYISQYVELLPGDIICTGSPAGNGAHYGRFLALGDTMEGHITGLGEQHIRCVA